MKKMTQIALTALLFVGITANAQTQLKKGSVTYNMTMPSASEEMAAMGESTIGQVSLNIILDTKNKSLQRKNKCKHLS